MNDPNEPSLHQPQFYYLRQMLCNMEITGYDNVIFTALDPRLALVDTIGHLTERWPGVLLTVILDNPPGRKEFNDFASMTLEELPESGSQIYAVRNKAMDDFAEEHAYALMDDGDGPVSFFYRKRGPLILELNGVNELPKKAAEINAVAPYDERLSSGFSPPDPYHAFLCSPILFSVTVVTPASPRDNSFSSWLVKQVQHSLLKVHDTV